MPELLKQARGYLDALEADRQAALTLSAQKAEEAELIQARLEGFRAAMEMLGRQVPVGNGKIGLSDERKPPGRRRTRRRIPELIVRELSFSGQAMTARQIADVVDYNLERTETALKRLEKDGSVIRDEDGRWAISPTALPHTNEHSRRVGNGKLPAPQGA
jgi:DNA-binding transcriptional ArsR family regulator